MSDDAELDLIRQSVNCAAVLERIGGGWTLDQRESTRRALKYQESPGQIIIVNHDSRGWWDATGSAKGDVFSLVQHLQPELNFGRVCIVLRRLVGIEPSGGAAILPGQSEPDMTVVPAQRWAKRPELTPGSKTWRYLREQRPLPPAALHRATSQDAVRAGAYDSAWFAHRQHGRITHVEVRGPTYKGSLRGGTKSLVRFGQGSALIPRPAVLEAPIDALSLAALEEERSDTLYVATGGGMGPGTLGALREKIARLGAIEGLLVIGTDSNTAGDRYAEQLERLAAEGRLQTERKQPPEGQDWNDVLKSEGRGGR